MTPESPLSRLEKLVAEKYPCTTGMNNEFCSCGNCFSRAIMLNGGKALLQILSEPGEACGTRPGSGKVRALHDEMSDEERCDVLAENWVIERDQFHIRATQAGAKLQRYFASEGYHGVSYGWQKASELARDRIMGLTQVLGKQTTELLQARAAHELELADIQRDGEQMIAQISTAMQKVVVERDAERAALASSEARVRILSTALMRISDTREHPGSKRIAEEALLEVNR